jgi:hypothetical protein
VLRHKPDVEITKDRLTDTWETTRDALAPRLSAAREAVTPYVDSATARVSPVLEEARVRLTPAVERLGPAVDTARERLRNDVVPAVIAAAETARETSAPARAEAKDRAAAALLALRGDRPQKVRRWPTAVACLLAGAAAGIAAGIIRRPQSRQTGPAPFPGPQHAKIDDDAAATSGAGPNGLTSPGSSPRSG